jgi:hypothetical protein
MTDTERRLLVQKCSKLLQDVLVEIRNLSYQEGNAKRINDLADLTHNVPEFLAGLNDYVLNYLRDGLLEYARKYHANIDPEKSRYVMLLDMDEATFNDLYRKTTWPWPEAAGAAG